MASPLRSDGPSEATEALYARWREVKPSPRVKTALRLWVSGIAQTKKEAARAAGLNEKYLTNITTVGNPYVQEFIEGLEAKLNDEACDMRTLAQQVGRRAFRNMAYMMENAAKEEVRFRAAQDLMDRSHELSKVQKHQIDSTHIDSADVASLATAMLESARLRASEKVQEIAAEGYSGGDTPEHVKALLDGTDKL